MSNPTWNADLYLRFERERGLPVRDLLHRVAVAPKTIVDLGCGPGNSTAALAERFPNATITGVDLDEGMLANARASDVPATWHRADLHAYVPAEPVDLLFSNAAYQWVHGQADVLPRLMQSLTTGGQLAMQIPTHESSAVHRAILDTLADGSWSSLDLGDRRIFEIHSPADYYDILAPHAAIVELWTTEYQHVLGSAGDVVAWIRGSGLRPYLQGMPEQHHDAFVTAFAERVAKAYPSQPDGRVIFPFRRLFFVATR
ncbi:MAG: methyltransferase domain-containing protein [Planctomycetota bacterium]